MTTTQPDTIAAAVMMDPARVEEGDWCQQDVDLAKHICLALTPHYPGHPFLVEVNCRQGIVVIKHTMLHPNIGFVLNKKRQNRHAPDKACIEGAGELLERAGIPRGPLNIDDWADYHPNDMEIA